jgi:zinc protease
MKNILIYISVVATLQSNAQNFNRALRPSAGPAPTIALADAKSFTLPNGLKVFVVENHKIPVVSYSIDLNIKPALQGNATGYKGFVGELLKSGTITKSKDKFNAELDATGATLAASEDGVFGSSLKKHQAKLLELMSDMIINPQFADAEVEKLKTQAISGIRSNMDDPEAMSANVVKSLVYGDKHIYGEVETEASIKNVTSTQIKKYHKTYFRPNVACMAVVGDITLEEAKQMVTKYFAKWQRAAVPTATYPTPKANDGARVAVVNKTGAVQSVVNVTYPIDLKPGTPDVIKAKVANSILGGGMTGRLFQNLRETHAWTYGSYSSIDADELDNAGSFSATANCKTAATDSSVVEIIKEMNRLGTEPVDNTLLENTKKYMAGNFALGLENPRTLANYAINIQKYKMDKNYYKDYLKNLAAVTAQDVMTISKKLITPGVAIVTVAGDKNELVPKLEGLAKSGKVEIYDMFGKGVKENASAVVPKNLKPIDVINNFIKVTGGIAAWQAINDAVVEMQTSMQGQTLTVTTKKKMPNKSLEEVSMMGNVMQKKVFDGTSGYMMAMGQKQEFDTTEIEDAKEDANFLNEAAFLNDSYKMSILGTEEVNGSLAYIIKIISPRGHVTTNFYDIKSGLKVKSTVTQDSPQGVMTASTEFEDYKDINGVKYPHTYKIQQGPMPMLMKVTDVKINSGLKDEVFN